MNATLQIITPDQVPAIYEPFRNQLAEIKASNASMVFDLADKKGNKAARSHIAKLRSSKAAIDKTRADAKAPILEAGRRLDADAKEIIAEFDAMIDQHQKPLDQYEAEERVRIALIRERVDVIRHLTECRGHGSEWIAAAIDTLEGVAIDDSFAELRAEAANMREVALAAQRSELPLARQREADAAELARIRQELADQQAAAAREKADRDEADRKATSERLAAAEREANLKRAAEKAEAAKKAAEEREAQAAADQARRDNEAKAAAARAAEAAVEAERKRVADEAATEAEAEAKLKADEEHRETVHRDVEMFLGTCIDSHEEIDNVLRALRTNKIPHVTLTY